MKKKEKKLRDIEEKRARRYILAVVIYTLVMAGIVAAAFLLPDGKDSAPKKTDITSNFSSVTMI